MTFLIVRVTRVHQYKADIEHLADYFIRDGQPFAILKSSGGYSLIRKPETGDPASIIYKLTTDKWDGEWRSS
jgi:hypothetical protein